MSLAAMPKYMYWVYIVLCSDDSLYTGWTNDVSQRVAQHNEGSGAKYTRGRGPVKLVYTEQCESKEAAMSREYAVKQLSRAQKMELTKSFRS